MNAENNTQANHVPVPKSGIVYGDIIYWGTIFGTFLTILGSVITFTTHNHYIDPLYLLTAVWEGKGVAEIWGAAEGIGRAPDGHWYLGQITTGNGLTMAGMAMGVFSVIPGLLAAGYVLLTREKMPLYAGLAVLAACITIAAMFA